MRYLLLIALAPLISMAQQLNPHAVTRLRMSEDAIAVTYRDKLSDDTYRDSQIVKQPVPTYPNRITLVATNDTPTAWVLAYEAAYDDGRLQTNYTHVVKTKRQVLDALLIHPSPPKTQEQIAELKAKRLANKGNANALAKARILAPTNTVRMAKAEPRILSSKIKGDKIINKMSDGSTTTNTLKRAYTARIKTVDKKR